MKTKEFIKILKDIFTMIDEIGDKAKALRKEKQLKKDEKRTIREN